MKIGISFIALLLLITAVGATSDEVAGLIQKERNFAKAAAEHGTRDAFLLFLADDSVLFRPTAVNGKQWMESHPARPGLLSWQPMQAEVSGNLGYTTGPWEYRKDPKAEKADAYGYFITVWKKQEDNTWKAVIDHGISSPSPETASALITPSPDEPKSAADHDLLKKELMDVDGNISAESYAKLAVDYAKMFRENSEPVAGREAIAAAVKGNDYKCRSAKTEISTTGNLGYTFGTCVLNNSDTNYLRVWRRQNDGSWKFVIDVVTPVE